MNRTLKIGNISVGDGQPTFVVAEIGINHNGFLKVALQMVRKAHEIGCSAVKFQKRTVEIVYSSEELIIPREIPADIIINAINKKALPEDAVRRLTDSNLTATTNGDIKRALELTAEEYWEIDKLCKDIEMIWFASPWDETSVDFLEQFNPPCYKIASASLTDDSLLRHIRSKGKPIILSTGMSDLLMIHHAVEILGTQDLVLLHCTSVYPKTTEEGDHGLSMLNLNGITTLRHVFNVPVGFSGHDTGIQPSFFAASLGACIIEKHFTLYRAMWGSDQAVSMEPDDLGKLCRAVKRLPMIKGDGIISIYKEEIPVMKKLRRKYGILSLEQIENHVLRKVEK